MNRFDFTPYRRSTVGFDRLFDLLERHAGNNGGDNYPPFNIERRGEDAYRITLAVAGFSPEQLAVTVEGRQLTIAGRREGDASADAAYLHRGIAARGFTRAFVLADGLEVEGARVEHGLLHVDLRRPRAAPTVRQIPIQAG